MWHAVTVGSGHRSWPPKATPFLTIFGNWQMSNIQRISELSLRPSVTQLMPKPQHLLFNVISTGELWRHVFFFLKLTFRGVIEEGKSLYLMFDWPWNLFISHKSSRLHSEILDKRAVEKGGESRALIWPKSTCSASLVAQLLRVYIFFIAEIIIVRS